MPIETVLRGQVNRLTVHELVLHGRLFRDNFHVTEIKSLTAKGVDARQLTKT